jgi:hypothetical protein
LPEQTGFSISNELFAGISDPKVAPLDPDDWCSTIEGLGIADSGPSKPVPAASLLDRIVDGSADAAEKDVLEDRLVSGLGDLVELAAEDEAEEVFAVLEVLEENGENTDPSTRFAFSREASFLSSMRNLESFLGSRGGGCGRRSNGMNPAGSRVIWIE